MSEGNKPERSREVDPSGLTEKEAKFALEYLVDLNKTQAYLRTYENASYETAMANSAKLMKKQRVRDAIQKEMDARASRTLITADRVIHELSKLAFSNSKHYYNEDGSPIPPHMLDDNLAAAVQEYDGEKNKLKLADKKSSLELLGKHLVLFTEKQKIEGDITHHTGVLVAPKSTSIDEWSSEAESQQNELKKSVTETSNGG